MKFLLTLELNVNWLACPWCRLYKNHTLLPSSNICQSPLKLSVPVVQRQYEPICKDDILVGNNIILSINHHENVIWNTVISIYIVMFISKSVVHVLNTMCWWKDVQRLEVPQSFILLSISRCVVLCAELEMKLYKWMKIRNKWSCFCKSSFARKLPILLPLKCVKIENFHLIHCAAKLKFVTKNDLL